MWTLLVLVLLSSQVMGLADNDNYVLYAEDIGGYPVLSSDGYLYLIGSNITKINLIDKVRLSNNYPIGCKGRDRDILRHYRIKQSI